MSKDNLNEKIDGISDNLEDWIRVKDIKQFIQEAQEELKEKIILPRYRKIVDKVFKNKFGDLAGGIKENEKKL